VRSHSDSILSSIPSEEGMFAKREALLQFITDSIRGRQALKIRTTSTSKGNAISSATGTGGVLKSSSSSSETPERGASEECTEWVGRNAGSGLDAAYQETCVNEGWAGGGGTAPVLTSKREKNQTLCKTRGM